MVHDPNETLICNYLAARLVHDVEGVRRGYGTASRNVCTVLRRQILNALNPTTAHPLCKLLGEEGLIRALGRLPLDRALLTLARIYDVAHVALCRAIAAARSAKPPNEPFTRNPCVDLRVLTEQIDRNQEVVEDEVHLEQDVQCGSTLRAVWRSIPAMNFDFLPELRSLSGFLPGERSPSYEYAGLGGGGGSDIISASLLGHLLRRHGKEMNFLVSTRTWAVGSQGKKDSKMGVKREVYNHGGIVEVQGRPVAGTFRVKGDTYAEGRDLEAIPVPRHSQVYMVLDQGESASEIPPQDRADLRDQFRSVLAQAQNPIDTVLIIDTGGDVFGADSSGATTPDQDFRVQRAMSTLSPNYNLVTAVVAPGVDAPNDAPQKAFKAGGMIYRPSKDEKSMMLDLLVDEYRMDGSDPSRFGKTTLALQARLRGVVGWTSLDLPEHVVDTWENPWNSFVYIRECFSDIILMPTLKLLPLIEPNTG